MLLFLYATYVYVPTYLHINRVPFLFLDKELGSCSFFVSVTSIKHSRAYVRTYPSRNAHVHTSTPHPSRLVTRLDAHHYHYSGLLICSELLSDGESTCCFLK